MRVFQFAEQVGDGGGFGDEDTVLFIELHHALAYVGLVVNQEGGGLVDDIYPLPHDFKLGGGDGCIDAADGHGSSFIAVLTIHVATSDTAQTNYRQGCGSELVEHSDSREGG